MPYEFKGEEYSNASTHQKEWGNRIISEFNLKGNEHILDLGCGDGVLTAKLASLVPHGAVLGIDASQGMISAARKLEANNLSFRIQDINSIDYENEFDLVFSNATLHWVKDHNLLLNNVFHCLKDGGMLRFNFGGSGNCSNFFQVIRDAIKNPDYSGYFTRFEWPFYMPHIDEYRTLVQSFSFRDSEVWMENADRYFPDIEAMVKWVDQPSLVPFLEYVPEPEKQRFRNHVVKSMIEVTLQNNGTCFETFRRINVRARK